jgi:hypothetical protein
VETTYADYTAGSRTVPLRAALLDAELWDAARRAFVLANVKRLAVRTVALTLDRLLEAEAQLELWGDGTADHQAEETKTNEAPDLQYAIDTIHSRYGIRAIVQGLSHRSRPATDKSPTAVPPYRRAGALYQATTIFPNVALPSMTRCASAS